MREPLYLSESKNVPNILDYRLRFLSYYLKRDYKTLLDISCGEGKFIRYFRWLGLEVEGTEVNDEQIKNCIDDGIKCKKVDLNKIPLQLPYDDNSFDVVSCTEVIEHIKYPKIVIDELYRVSKYLVLLTTPIGESYMAPDHIHFFQPEDINVLVREYNNETLCILTKAEDYPMNQRCFVIAIFK